MNATLASTPAKRTTENSPWKTLVFIDTGLQDWQSLAAGARAGVAVFVLDRDRDGVEQIAAGMKNYRAVHGSIDAVHIFSHGSPGRLYLGSTVLGADTLDDYKPLLRQWRNTAGTEILLYGCHVAEGEGAAFVERLSELTGATVAASTDLTGSPARGGNWNLEYTTGTIKAPAALRPEALAAYNGVLAILTVTSTADSGAGSLREAIEKAQAGDTIQFSSSLANKTITLTSGQLNIKKNLTVDGAAAAGVAISGNNASRVFYCEARTTVTLKNLTITNGKLSGTSESDEAKSAGAGILTGYQNTLILENCQLNNNVAGYGGGLVTGNRSNTTVINCKFDSNDGSLAPNTERGGGAIAVKSGSVLTVKGSEFTNNTGTYGGAINNLLSGLTVENTKFINNSSKGNVGGAIYTDGGSERTDDAVAGNIIIRGSLFDGNTATREGGGAFLFAYPPDKIAVENSTFINNKAGSAGQSGGSGGGLRAGNGELTISNSTFANNQALDHGGALWVGEKTPLNITNTTFSGNSAANLGGAMYLNINSAYATTITNATIANNYAGGYAGAIFIGAQPVTVTNSIFANNSAGNPYNTRQQTNRELIDNGNNLQFPNKLTTNLPNDNNVTANVNIADPLIGPLQENGGGTPTHALLAGSPAINGGVPVSGLVTDQRGIPRTDGRVDVGAFEFTAIAPSLVPPTSDSVTLTGGNFLTGGSGNDALDGGLGNDSFTGGTGTDMFAIRAGDGTDVITDFGGARTQMNRTRIADPSTVDTLKFQGAGLTAQNMLLTQNGADLSVKFNGVANTEAILKNFSLQNLENLLAGSGSYVTSGNILFEGNTQIQDSFDVISAAEQPGSVAKANTTTFLNDLNNSTQGKENSSDVINAQGGSDTISGLSGSDILRGGDGNDRLDGGLDGDILTGNAGRDQFVLKKGSGGDIITDFTDGEDSLVLAGGLTVSKLSITSSPTTRTGSSSTLISLAQTGELLATLDGISPNSITALDFTVM